MNHFAAVLAIPTVLALAMTAFAQPSADAGAIRYALSFPAPETHYVEVEASYPTEGAPHVELMMAVWTPGSYLVREYARHVEGVEVVGATGSSVAGVEKTAKNRWRVPTGGEARVTVRYRVYGREMSVRTNWIEQGFALLNGAPTFLTPVDGLQRPHRVSLTLPDGWATAVSGMHGAGSATDPFRAANFDVLVDSPIVAGSPAIHEFDVDGTPHLLVNVNEDASWDGARAATDVAAIVRAHRDMWGSLPYERYVFLNVITEAGGGLEHANSTVLMTSRWAMGTRQDYLNWLNLVSHELFHAWNIKRLRPRALGPFDYERENYTPSLWVAEGFTTYYGDLLVRRAGLASPPEYLAFLSDEIRTLQTTPGRLVQPVGQASFDAWIKYYRPDENTRNTAVSYYTKGAVIAAVLDARIRAATGNARSLDDVMRRLFERHAGATGFTEDELRAVVSEVAGSDQRDWLARAVDRTDELDYTPLLDTFGLQFAPADPDLSRGWLGLETRDTDGRLVVTRVVRDTPGFEAGFNVDDEILAIDDYRVRADQWSRRLLQYPPSREAEVLVARREKLLRLPVTFGADPGNAWRLRVRPNVTAGQRAALSAWLGAW